MQKRLLEFTTNAFNKLRPVIFVVLAGLALVSAMQLKDQYVPKPEQPLVKIQGAEGVGGAGIGKSGADEQSLVVSITGAIVHPGVYEFSFQEGAGVVVQALIDKAGGFTKRADLSYVSQKINLARQLAGNEQIYIPSVDEKKLLEAAGSSSSGSGGSSASSGSDQATEKVNINTATSEGLQTLPGVGPSTAEKIISARPFSSIEDIKNVSGIGDATFNKLKDLISV
jgi:competence protein ComEA